MSRKYRKFDEDFKQGALELVTQTGKPIAQVARDLGVNEGTLGNRCAKRRRASGDPACQGELRPAVHSKSAVAGRDQDQSP